MLCTDSMGKEINRGVLIMQCGDTDLILCLSTCTDILMHSAPLLSSTQEVFTLFVQSLEKKKDTSCLTEVTSLPKPPKDINENAGATCWVFFCVFFFFLPTIECSLKHSQKVDPIQRKVSYFSDALQ